MNHIGLKIAVAAAVAAAIGVSSGTAAPYRGVTASLNYGTLMVKGTQASDKIALRLRAADSSVLEVDANDDGSADFRFARSDIARIVVDGRAGTDRIRIDDSNGPVEDKTPTILAGGDGKDTLAGGSGAENLLGGRGNDTIDGNRGADTALMGGGDDTFIWDPGDGSDKVEGQRGSDTMVFNGANAAEQVDVSANGTRLRFFRNPGNITMDTAGVERVDFNALGGADVVTVNDLKGTAVRRLNIDLAAALGGSAGDGQADRVIVAGTAGNDRIDVSGNAGAVKVGGLAAAIGILHPEAALDRVEINTLGGVDSVAAGALSAGAIQLFVDGALVQ
jgi:Ca2+-binding RTX toxin-like protein